MSAIERAYRAWDRLLPKWNDYCLEAGLRLTGTPLESFADELLEPVRVNFRLPGLEDFCRSGCRAIEPGDPARSLLYHIFASPGVVPPGLQDDDYPTPEELQAIEDCVYGIVPPSLDDLHLRAEGGPLALVVFAYEYNCAADTVHKRHADLCFSRTGLSRIGNAAPRYMPKARGFLPFGEAPDATVHAAPCRFGAFLATTKKGDSKGIGPERFQAGDGQRDFWIPLHKLFSGTDCMDGFDLRVEFAAHHVNERIRRIHLALQQEGQPVPWTAAELNEYPFRIIEGIAELGRDANYNLLTPVPHDLVEVAKKADGTIVSFAVPENHQVAEGALWFQGQQNARHSPELVHVKHALVNGEVKSLLKPKGKSIEDVIQKGGYQAVNFVDRTADGWVEARCSALAAYVPQRLAAYSVVAQPDFFPLVQQRALMEWWENSAPLELKDSIFPYQLVPVPLTDDRMPVNFTLAGAEFDSTDQTMTAIVGMARPPQPPGRIRPVLVARESTLSQRATGLFFPGWDCSRDFDTDDRSPNGALHLAHYGIGSPFVEDTMICSAHGSFWPAAAPDTTRFFPPGRYPSVTPILDSDAGWDGVPLPARKGQSVQFRNLVYTDYVELLRKSQLTYGQFAHLTLDEYVARTMALARAFQALGVTATAGRLAWSVLKFAPATAKELAAIPRHERFAGLRTFRVELAQIAMTGAVPEHREMSAGKASSTELLFCSAGLVARQVGGGWHVDEF
ncbi:MAG TPA: hypothetical protein VHW09_19130 [Bryobacteraceae bacterium]|jgi:hypothetical protein|nr:hypothetical protein [Bryobacteraceae bacterium]